MTGKITTIRNSDVLRCPYAILLPSHYRPDGSCRCNDPTHTEMREWGYHWHPDIGRWSSHRPRKPKPQPPTP